MKKIYLFCSAGMSTSILANKMQECANSYSIPVEVKAFPHCEIANIVKTLSPDCILLGPQVKYTYDETKKIYGEENGIPVAVIDRNDYGLMKAENVLKMAVVLIKNSIKN
ncbi:PTS sugar transporter subunit IIB [Cetobacterium sp.]|uniref:PTS sugar transporter subunit IIB n=1 Tax=Cetobacterium sp. TaxID=2071632 RepID=UPI0025C6063C|nr:PTS sugar transporter subunit IIB [Cetobacterium sp.]